MHNFFYASGFLYHSPTQQILLQQLSSDTDSKLVMFRVKCQKGENPQSVFQRCVEDALGVHVAASSIHPVYDYVHDQLGEHFIFYAEVAENIPAAYSSKNKTEWFSLAKLSKLDMNEQTRHDIVIGERVIRSLMESAGAPRIPNRN